MAASQSRNEELTHRLIGELFHFIFLYLHLESINDDSCQAKCYNRFPSPVGNRTEMVWRLEGS